MPCTFPPTLPVKIQMSHFAMYFSPCFTCQNSYLSFCHVLFLLLYLSKFVCRILPCIIPPALPAKIPMSHFAMYNSSRFTCQNSYVAFCHVLSSCFTWVMSTLYAKIRLNPSKIKGFRGYKPLPPLSLAYQPSILLRETSQGRAESPFISALTEIP